MERMTLYIDVFDEKKQEAEALSALTPSKLIKSILQEFSELEYLSESPDEYLLLQAESNTPLHDDKPIGIQLKNKEHLVMTEKEKSLPNGTNRPTNNIYLRDQVTGDVYKVRWLPAVIGRPDKSKSHDDWLSVNLEQHNMGLRVSRRHLQLTEENGRYFLTGTPRNPTLIKGVDGDRVSVTEKKRPLSNADIIHLERSNIDLKFIIRE